MDVLTEIERYQTMIKDTMQQILLPGTPRALYDAMGYSIFSGGKRMRPILLLAAANTVGGSESQAMPFACALEFIHTYSLIHDDLPCMDNDDMRRGVLTNHKVFGEGLAVLAGDAMLNLAYEMMSRACYSSIEDGNVENNLAAMVEIAESAGIRGMVGGQCEDIEPCGEMDEDRLIYIHSTKTAAIIKAALTAGGLIGGARDDVLDVLSEAGFRMGMAFQIMDDLSDDDVDKKEHASYVTLFSREKAIEDCKNLSESAVRLMEKLPNPFLAAYVRHIFEPLERM